MQTPVFFQRHPLPVFEYLSPASMHALEAYLASGNRTFRERKLLEFFKALDWLPMDDLEPDNPLKKLDTATERQINREINRYYAKKAETRAEAAEQRKDYKLRIFAYYRERLSSADKVLLESLRDYELDITGRDVNWRHYFTLDSFKKIDDFINATAAERYARIQLFKQDVQTYKKNLDKMHYQAQCDHTFTFDDWCDMASEEAARGQRSRSSSSSSSSSGGSSGSGGGRQKTAQGLNNVVYQAFQTLGLPWTATPEMVKRQFRQLTLKHHPDLPSGCEETMKRIISAYEEIQRAWQIAGEGAFSGAAR